MDKKDLELIIDVFERYRLDLDNEWSSDLWDNELELLERLKKQLSLVKVSRSKRVNIITFENDERCFKISEKNLLNMIKKKRIEKGDKHYKCELIKKY